VGKDNCRYTEGDNIDFVFAGDGKHGWISRSGHNYVFGFATREDFVSVRLDIGKVPFELPTADGKRVFDHGLSVKLVDFQPKFPMEVLKHTDSEGNVLITVVKDGNVLQDITKRFGSDMEGSFRRWREGELDFDGQLSMQIQDSLGSNFHITWPGVSFVRTPIPLYQNPWFVTLAAFLGIALLVAGALLVLRPLPRVSSWSPFACWVLSGALTQLPGLDKWLYPTVLLGMLAGTLLLAFGWGLCSARAFRMLCRAEPFSYLSPAALRLGFVRRRLFAEYAKAVQKQLQRSRGEANNEVYVPLAAKIQATDVPARISLQPAQEICALLTHRDLDARQHVLLESAGGLGKSALLREVVRLALEQFRQDPCSPLPVFW
jgi:hypothetical protein